MPKIAYALYDSSEAELHLFAEDSDILAKDAVAAFLTQNVIPKNFGNPEDANELLSQIALAVGPDNLKEVLIGWDFDLAMLLV